MNGQRKIAAGTIVVVAARRTLLAVTDCRLSNVDNRHKQAI
jgi:hypothetical protein